MPTDVQHELVPPLNDTDRLECGQVIFLNGTSSSGKTTVAKALQEILGPTYFHVQIDSLNRQFYTTSGGTENEMLIAHQRMVLGFYRAVAGLASVGNHVIVDQLFGERWRMLDCLRVFAGYDVVLVGVHCALEELNRRERARGNRGHGRAAAQLGLVHADLSYDVEIDTGRQTPHDCATVIRDHLATGHRERAFDRLRESAS
ncbi:MAG TPA: AAA family ATPase [Mycobacteriales bacterium]|nr:AAA family ATPase [Mycobacteriales bacterium]